MKNAETNGVPVVDHRTRDRLASYLLRHGEATAAELAIVLGVSSAAVRRHLDVMLADGDVICREQRILGHRGRGRPARTFQLAGDARVRLATHTYDDLAADALRWIASRDGAAGVAAFAAHQVSVLEAHCQQSLASAGDEPVARAQALAAALTTQGYAASASAIATGGQLCQHHCPVAHVAAEFPQLCEAETEVISRLVGTHVQRLATIANGDGICTTHIPDPRGRHRELYAHAASAANPAPVGVAGPREVAGPPSNAAPISARVPLKSRRKA